MSRDILIQGSHNQVCITASYFRAGLECQSGSESPEEHCGGVGYRLTLWVKYHLAGPGREPRIRQLLVLLMLVVVMVIMWCQALTLKPWWCGFPIYLVTWEAQWVHTGSHFNTSSTCCELISPMTIRYFPFLPGVQGTKQLMSGERNTTFIKSKWGRKKWIYKCLHAFYEYLHEQGIMTFSFT